MKPIRNLRYLLPLLVISFFASCESDSWHNIRGAGPVVNETRVVPVYRDISVAIPADVYIYQSPEKELTIEAQANVLDAIETFVTGNELKIKLANGAGLGSHEPINIYISSAMFNTIRLSGTANLYSETPIVTDVFDVSISGSGNVDVAVIANSVRASISGSGQMWIEGTTLTEQLTISGSGDIYSYDLHSDTSDINISGSGNAEVSMAEFMKARISGSGSIYYMGYPTIDSRISGSGRIVHVI